MTRWLALALAPLLLAAATPAARPGPAEIVAAAPAADWAAIAADDLVVLDLAGGRRVAIALAPEFAPAHVANIRALVRGGWFDGNAVVRVQDDYVVQWGGADPRRPLPPGGARRLPAEYERPLAGLDFVPGPKRDAYAPRVGYVGGWPVASDGRQAWLAHCYAMVGVGRDMPPDTGDGSELYTVIGHAPRHLDRNIALVGRVVAGIESLSTLPRGTGEMGFYTDPAQRTAIVRARIAADIPTAERPAFEELRPASPSFTRWLAAKTDRTDAFFVRPAGAIDLCNALPPVRPRR